MALARVHDPERALEELFSPQQRLLGVRIARPASPSSFLDLLAG
jgi:hypothetical protein